MSFYNDIFPDNDLWVRRSNFLSHHLISRLLWARLCLLMSKVKIGMDRILALGETHEIGGHLSVKLERGKLILEWPTPQNPTDIRSLLGNIIIITRRWVKNYIEMARPLQSLIRKVEWQWEEAEQLSFI